MADVLRVLHVFGRLDRGGAETMVMNLYRNIDRKKIQFDFVIHTEKKCSYEDEIRDLGGRIYRVPMYTGKNHFNYIKSWHNLFQEHKEHKIIHGHVRSTASIYLKVAKKHGLITIAHSHNTSSGKGIAGFTKSMLQFPIRFVSDYFFACSEYAGRWLFGNNILNSENFYILKNAIDTSEYLYAYENRKKIRDEFGISDGLVVGHVGRFHHQKNHEFLINVFKQVHEVNNSATLILVGDGELRDSIEKKVCDLGLSDSVIFTGIRSDVPHLLQAMDIFLFPSRYEGLPVILIEAQTSGLNCLISETITKDVEITNSLQYLPISESPKLWAKELLSKYGDNKSRTSNRDDVVRAGYDIVATSSWYERFCLKLSSQ